MRGVRSCFTRRWRPSATPDTTAAVRTLRFSSAAKSSLLGVRAASSSAAAATNTSHSEWKKRIEQGPSLADFLKAKSNGSATTAPSEDDGDDDEMRRPTPEESLEQIRDMLQQIREAVSHCDPYGILLCIAGPHLCMCMVTLALNLPVGTHTSPLTAAR